MVPSNISALLNRVPSLSHTRLFSTTTANHNHNRSNKPNPVPEPKAKLTHVSPSGTAHMVSISEKTPTKRTATARCAVRFSSPLPATLIRDNQMKKGDVLGVARIAGIMTAKRTADIIPLCHPVAITHVSVELEVVSVSASASTSASNPDPDPDPGSDLTSPSPSTSESNERVEITATVSCDGKTGVEMEALTAAGAAALTVYDMCKAVDKGMVIEGLRVVLKEGGKSGRWVEGERESEVDVDE